MPARQLQARLLDATDAVVDAVPRGGEVQFIRAPGIQPARLDELLWDSTCTPRPEDLEDAVMMLLKEKLRDEAAPAAQASPAPQLHPDTGLAVAAERPAGGAPAAIRVMNLVRKFGTFTAVAGVSFEVAHGEIFGLLGPNGAGKTTTFRMLCGLLPATSGTLTVAGVNLRTARAKARARIGYVSQRFALYSNLTVHENLTVFGGAYGLSGEHLKRRIAAMLAQYDLPPHAKSGDLPGGYQQRLAMAVGLLHEPDILFLDEPTSGIDPLARRAFWRTITGLAGGGVTIIITTHFMEEAEYCDRIAILDAGALLALGTPAQVRAEVGAADMNSAFIAVVERARAQALRRAGGERA
jgi:ABC-2 type transport system ATP-binding protein